MTPAQRRALEYARNDGVLLVARRGTVGSLDSRSDVQTRTVMKLFELGLLKLNISHSDDASNGFELTDKGRQLLETKA